MRLAAKADAIQGPVIRALEAIGCKVYYLKLPVDLLVGFRDKYGVRRNILLEVKSRTGTHTQLQREFLETWPGEAYTVRSVDEALEAVLGKEALR